MFWPFLKSLTLLCISGAVAMGLSYLWGRGLRFLWDTKIDPHYRLAHTVAPFRLVLAIAVAGFGIGPLLSTSLPAVGIPVGQAIVVTIVVFLVLGHRWIQDAIGGVVISARQAFTIHDQLATDKLSGRVVSLGLTRVGLQTPDGALIDVPCRELASHQVRLSHGKRKALPIEVKVPYVHHPGKLSLELMRDQVLLSAYVDAGAPVIVAVLDEETAVVRATPLHPDDADALIGDLTERSWQLADDRFDRSTR